MKLPKSFYEITISQYQKVNRIYSSDSDLLDKEIEVVSFLSGKSIDEVEKIELTEFKKLAAQISFLSDKSSLPTNIKPFVFSGKLYKPCLDISELSTAQYIDLNAFLKKGSLIEQFHNLLACVYTPVNFWGKAKKYDSSKHSEIASDMLNVKVGDVSGLLFFYSDVLEKTNPTILKSLDEATQLIKEVIQEINQDKEFLSSVGVGGM